MLGEIAGDLPDFTQHDISHCDALWEMADLICGESLVLNPVEGFVLGAVFLLHDAALSLGALPGRLEDLKQDPLWIDTAVTLLRKHLRRQPTTDETAAVADGRDRNMQQRVAATVLRSHHAEYAERLAVQPYTASDGEQFYLIEDESLRNHFGRDIGRIAASHGRSIEKVAHDFASLPPLPPIPGRGPSAWQVDRLKLACLIRACDAIHIDGRRAPGFLWAIRHPVAGSDPHWQFQRHISVSHAGDRIQFLSGYAFPPSEALAWWTGYELIQNAARELGQVDALLADLGRSRPAVRGVFGADSPERLSRSIPTEGWEPVEARIRVSNVVDVARSLGGESLYGRHTGGIVPLRELIQNGCDAVRARRLLDPDDPYSIRGLGEVVVRRGQDEHGVWIEVEDNGIGMSQATLTGPLLDFGASLWNSTQLDVEWPGLRSRKFQATGKFGIGFFSVFMWGERVRVTSRRYDQGRDSTRVLEWQQGLDWNPLLRRAGTDERIADGGTRVRVWVPQLSGSADQVNDDNFRLWDLLGACTALCPALDVNLDVELETQPAAGVPKEAQPPRPNKHRIVGADDWIDCDGKELLRRVWFEYYNFAATQSTELLESVASNLRPLHSNGKVIGRACLFDWRMGFDLFNTANYRCGCITVGGLRAAELTGIAGVLVGEPERAARDEATPLLESEELARWVTEQASLFAGISSDFDRQVGAAQIVRMCGGVTGPLFITAAGHPEGFVHLSHDDIASLSDFPDEIIVLDFSVLDGARLAESIRLHANVFLTKFDYPSLLFRTAHLHALDWKFAMPQRVAEVPDPEWHSRYASLFGGLIEAVAAQWKCSIPELIAASTMQSPHDSAPIEREIGLINDRPITQQVLLLRRPQLCSEPGG